MRRSQMNLSYICRTFFWFVICALFNSTTRILEKVFTNACKSSQAASVRVLARFWCILGGSSVAITSIDTSDASLGSPFSVLWPIVRKIVSYRCIKLKKKSILPSTSLKLLLVWKNELDRPVRLPRLSFNHFYTLALVVHIGASIWFSLGI